MSTLTEYQKENELLRSQLSEANKKISDLQNQNQLTEEEGLRHSEIMFRTLYESTSDAVMLLYESGFTDCNNATLKMFGCPTKEEFCSKHPADLSPPKQPCGTDSMTLANQRISTAMKEGSCQFEWNHKRVDNGKVFFAEVRLNRMILDGKTLLQASVRDISERKQIEIDALHTSEEAFDGTFNQAAVGIAHVGLDGGWLRVNKKLTDILGYTEDELKHLTFQSLTHPNDLGTDLEYLNQVLEGTIQTYSMEKRYIQKSGDFVWANLTVSLVRKADGTPDYFISVVQDISKRKLAEDELRKSELRFKAISDTSPLAIYVAKGIEEKGIYMNSTFTKLFGYTFEEIPSVNEWWPMAYPDEKYRNAISEEWNEKVAHAIETHSEIEPMEVIVTCKDGSQKEIQWGFKTIGEENWAFGLDLTERKREEKQLKLHMRQAQMGEMISMIAHQWRQPLGAIASTSIDLKMQMELENFDLKEEKGRKECLAYFSNGLEDIDALLQNLTTTIDDFRNFYKPNKEMSSVYFLEPISKAIDIIKASLIADGIEIIQTCLVCNKQVQIHSGEIMQVILNIIKNAQDNFKEKGTKYPKITIECKCISDEKTTVEICDNGGGIPEDVIQNIFDPYFSTKDEKNGTGLGLYMSKTIIEEHHNGKLRASNSDDGACFTIEL